MNERYILYQGCLNLVIKIEILCTIYYRFESAMHHNGEEMKNRTVWQSTKDILEHKDEEIN